MLLTTIQVYYRFIVKGSEITWTAALVSQVVLWTVWAILSPFIFRLARRFPIDRKAWPVGLLVHLPTSVGVALAYVAFYTGFVGLSRESLSWDCLFISFRS